MSLKSLHFLHIGDIHYPDAKNERLVDDRDAAFPPAITGVIQCQPLTSTARKVAHLLERLHPKATGLVLTGDLTSRGDISGYHDCLEYLNRLLNFKRWKEKYIHVVPGNHDVDRSVIDPQGDDITSTLKKFVPFSQEWEKYNLPVLALGMRATDVSLERRQSGVKVISLNSSIGCGERRHLPEPIAEQLYTLLSEYCESVGQAEAFSMVGETLDTPAFNQSDLERICQSIEDLDPTWVPILVTHHNLLPQALPKVAIYTELLNAGTMRSRLLKLQRPIIYCHGHIHDYPVEVLESPEFQGSRIISISAPRFSRGFNWITIEFAMNGIPLGCVLDSFRLSERDCEIRPYRFRIPFHSFSEERVRAVAHAELRRVIASMPDEDTRLPDLVDKYAIEKDVLVNHLLEGEWLGLLDLTGKEEQPEYWTVRKAIP